MNHFAVGLIAFGLCVLLALIVVLIAPSKSPKHNGDALNELIALFSLILVPIAVGISILFNK